MPADRRAGLILRDQRLPDVRHIDLREARRSLTQPKQELRHFLGLLQRSLVVVVTPTVRHHAPLPEVPLELELPKREWLNLGNELALLRRRDDTRLVAKALGNGGIGAKQAELVDRHRTRSANGAYGHMD